MEHTPTPIELFREYLLKEWFDLDVNPTRIHHKYLKRDKSIPPLPYKLFAVKDTNADEGVVELRCYLFDTKYVFVYVEKNHLPKGMSPAKR